MALSLHDCTFTGPALPEPYVQFELEKELGKRKLLPKTTGQEGRDLQTSWEAYRRALRELVLRAGKIRVANHVLAPLCERLGYARMESADQVQTREGLEDGGQLLIADGGGAGPRKLRVWSVDLDTDLDAPSRRGYAYRFSHARIAQRVLLASGERVGLLTNGTELRVLISDPARPDSQVVISIDPSWKRSRNVPDSYLLLLALASPRGTKALAGPAEDKGPQPIIEKARLQQTRVTKDLRVQARRAIQQFIQEVLDDPENAEFLAAHDDKADLARRLWREGLITVYRILFIFKLESTDDPARSFSFASSSLWRNTFSPTLALARYVQPALAGEETGHLLEHGLRALFRMFTDGLACPELTVKPLGGVLFGPDATPILSTPGLRWGELAVAKLLDNLLWTRPKKRTESRRRVHYGPLDVEDLGRVYEALLELEPGIAAEPMCRLRRQKLEVVVPIAQGEKYRPADQALPESIADELDLEGDSNAADADEDESPSRAKKTKVEWIEAIPPDRFYLRVGLGRKATGSYYTPHSFVRFLVQETLGPTCQERSPADAPQPSELLKIKVLDPAMGSGHFLVEACRFLGERLYEACRLCDEKAIDIERDAEKKTRKADREGLLAQAAQWRQRVIDIPDPDDELLRYLPSRSPEGELSGLSESRAIALCRRLVAVHCLYGVDKNPLAVELAKLALWIEAHCEGLPLTFLDHRLVVGDSLTGPFWDKLTWYPGQQRPVDDIFREGIAGKLGERLANALADVKLLESNVGASLAEVIDKRKLKADLDRQLLPFRILAAAWAGGVMLGENGCDDDAYAELLHHVGTNGELPEQVTTPRLRAMIARGLDLPDGDNLHSERHALVARALSADAIPALPYDLAFPEVFHPNGVAYEKRGFDVVLGNPPWDKFRLETRELLGSFDPELLTGKERGRTRSDAWLIDVAAAKYPEIRQLGEAVSAARSAASAVAPSDANAFALAGSDPDLYQLFAVRASHFTGQGGQVGFVIAAGLIKNPADKQIRRALACLGTWRYILHFVNLRRLFADLPPVVEFALFCWTRQEKMSSRVGFDLLDDACLYQSQNQRLRWFGPGELSATLVQDNPERRRV